MRPLRSVFLLFFLLPLLTICGLGAFFLDEEPIARALEPPSSEDVEYARYFSYLLREATKRGIPEKKTVTLSQDQIDAIVRVASRFTPQARYSVLIEDGVVHGRISVPIPWVTGTRWLNIDTQVPGYEGQLELRLLKVGGHELPPAVFLRLAQRSLDLVFGDRAGTRLVEGFTSLQVFQSSLILAMHSDDQFANDSLSVFLESLRGGELPTAEVISVYYVLVRSAMDSGELPTEGSLLPYIQFVLRAVMQRKATGNLADEYTAAMLALTRICGSEEFTLLLGQSGEGWLDQRNHWGTDCDRVSLVGRTDARVHFTTSAALRAVSNRGVSVTLGELKELQDLMAVGNGFDLTDIAANNAGVRMSDLFMSQTADRWPAIMAKIEGEEDLLPSLDGIPTLLRREEFEVKFRDVDSIEYRMIILMIDSRIDRLRLYAEPPVD